MSEDLRSCRYEPVALSNESTVVAEFLPEFLGVREAAYQSEAELEKAFIKQLQVQAYEYLPIASEADLIANLRRQLEKLNKLPFSTPSGIGSSVPALPAAMTASSKRPRASRKTTSRYSSATMAASRTEQALPVIPTVDILLIDHDVDKAT